MWTIYKLTYKNGLIYIGQTSRLRQRIGEHRAPSSKLHRGRSFSVEILAEAPTKDEAFDLESKWILALDSQNPERGYNVALGKANVLKGKKFPGEMLERRRKKMIGQIPHPQSVETREKIRKKISGLKRSPETRGKISAARIRPVMNLDTGEIYPSLGAAAASIGKHKSGVSSCCIGRRPSSGGFRWAYA